MHSLRAQVIFIISPIALFISAAISYSIFNDCRGNESENWPMNNDFDDFRCAAVFQRSHAKGLIVCCEFECFDMCINTCA